MNPVILIANGAKRLPSFFNRNEAITVVLPVYSSSKPKAVPNTIISPKFFKILPNPSFIVVITSPRGMLIPKPTSKHARKREKNAGTLNLVERITISAMPTTNKMRM